MAFGNAITDSELWQFYKNTCHARIVSFEEFKQNYYQAMKIEHCRACGKEIVFLPSKNGKSTPVDADTVREVDDVFEPHIHTSYFATCTDPARFKRRRQPTKQYHADSTH